MPFYVAQCHVCNSKFRNQIEELSLRGLNPQAIYNWLQSIQDPNEKAIVQRENIKPSAIRRHIDKHFNKEEVAQLKLTETHNKIEQSRDMLKNNISIKIDKANSLSHMVDVSLLKIEEIEEDASVPNRQKYVLINNYMNTARGLIESLAKLTGELQQEGTIDINFFSNEISMFADIVLEAIRETDKELNMSGQIETAFSKHFKAAWTNYKDKQTAVVNGETKQTMSMTNNFNSGMN